MAVYEDFTVSPGPFGADPCQQLVMAASLPKISEVVYKIDEVIR